MNYIIAIALINKKRKRESAEAHSYLHQADLLPEWLIQRSSSSGDLKSMVDFIQNYFSIFLRTGLSPIYNIF